jgi:hypothetical protein
MYRIDEAKKRDAKLRWALPNRVFFACGACHILAFAFLERYGSSSLKAMRIKPASGFTGNHILIAASDWVFDYHGYSCREHFFTHTYRKADRWWPGWQATLVELPPDVLISESKSRTYDGLWLREPSQFLHDALPRARTFLDRFPKPQGARFYASRIS